MSPKSRSAEGGKPYMTDAEVQASILRAQIAQLEVDAMKAWPAPNETKGTEHERT